MEFASQCVHLYAFINIIIGSKTKMMDLVGICFKMHLAYNVFVNSIAMAYTLVKMDLVPTMV
jgi:hypothetical protein